VSEQELVFDVVEIFKAIQGEGPTAGIPVIFLRLANCNLSCKFCDSAYAWRWKGDAHVAHDDEIVYDKGTETRRMSVSQIVDEIDDLVGKEQVIQTLVVSGGEPMFWNKTLHLLLVEINETVYIENFEIETNGTIVPDEGFDALEFLSYNVSPKLSNSGDSKKMRLKEKALSFFADKDSAFKFVVNDVQDLKEVNKIVDDYDIPPYRVYLQPQSRTAEEFIEKSKWIIELCLVSGYTFGARLHTIIFGNERGR
jgi:organic radical activating enzyme